MKRFQKNMMHLFVDIKGSVNVCIHHYEANNRYLIFLDVGGESRLT